MNTSQTYFCCDRPGDSVRFSTFPALEKITICAEESAKSKQVSLRFPDAIRFAREIVDATGGEVPQSPHWPAGGAVTGEQLQAALHAEELAVEVSAYSSMLGSFDERLDRAAARLSAQPVAFDVEACAWDVVKAVTNMPPSVGDMTHAVAAILRRHAAAPATGVGVVRASTDGVGFSPKSYRIFCDALALFEESVDDGDEGEDRVEAHDRVVDAARQCIADSVAQQLALRARATTAGQTTGAQWVRRPEGQASALVVPFKGSRYMWQDANDGKWHYGKAYNDEPFHEEVSAYRLIKEDGSTGPVINRTPATAGGWTDLDVAACVGQHVVEQYDGTYSETHKWADDVDARCIATTYDATGVVAYYILPPVEAQP
jgi:hypothetical protein